MQDFDLGSLTSRGTRRVIYNSDPSNTTARLSDPVAKPEELRAVVRDYATKGGIDTLVQEVWHQGWTEFWRSDLCGYDARPQHQRLVPMMDGGVMPLDIYVDECHTQGMTFVAGFRMNDRHGHNADWFEQLGKEKPEWVLKGLKPSSKRTTDPRSYEVGCALDYSVAAVRDWVFSLMEEVANRFDVDGIELNYTRLPACFRREGVETGRGMMTDLVRRVRVMLDAVGEKKGRRLLLGARVLADLDGCLKVGLDVPTWVSDGLIDYVAPGDIGFTVFNAQWEKFVTLARAHDCFVYPQVQLKLGYDHRDVVQTADHYRAAVQNMYGAGADGYSTQNYFEVEKYDTLKILQDPKLIAQGNRHYVFYPIWGPNSSTQAGFKGDFPYHTEEIVLDRNALGKRGTFRFRLCEHLPRESKVNGKEVISGAILICRPSIVMGDEIVIDVNGEVISEEDVWYDWDDGPLVCFALNSPPAVYGDNVLGMTLNKSALDGMDVVLSEVEVFVKAE